MPRDTTAMTDEVDHFDEPTDDAKRATQRVTCAFAQRHDLPPSETKELLLMLGVHPSQMGEYEPLPKVSRFV